MQPAKKYTVIPTEAEAIAYAIQHAQKGSFIVDCSEKINETISIINKCKAEEDEYGIVVGNSIYKNEDPQLLTGLISLV